MNGSGLGAGTIAASARHYGGSQNIEYNVHNLYGLMESKATRFFFSFDLIFFWK